MDLKAKTKINILSHSRFHMLDLARELSRQGFDVRFYSFVPKKRCAKFGLPEKNCRSLFYYLAPLLLIKKYFRSFDYARRVVQDFLMGTFMRKCDIVISLTGFVYAPKKAKRKNATVIIERGSKHILEQKKILESNPYRTSKANVIPKSNIRQNLEAYELADYVSVPSRHALESFLLHGYPEKKLFRNPYGVDLSMFYQQSAIRKEYDFIMVGGWSYQKGCDLIVKAIEQTNYTFLHVGGLVDLDFPKGMQFTHIDSVDQSKLVEYYNKAKIFVLPSRQEGLGMVQLEAMACNLPIIGSKQSGAEDIRQMVESPQYITIIDSYTPEAVIKAMDKAMEIYPGLVGKTYAGKAVENLTWEAYGKRYADFIHSIMKDKQ